ncbi:hypothetical protein CH379_017300 [Leptospira ellisii]|uniref:Uncharacterized protein n=1 Tax=Leptospira ellisii TaxID=2023197 RepID=A0A2N0BAS5_9LEPT|nr:hypothetical protein [Leptospira ellisii]MDV6237393.1 hypothetical protein [Leptospira ellisii]PJZ93650.1 hypothetical protein CH379_06795 [Leptospira ellisii]PKA05007.1 hypothetical protein CH375_07650 [Leptospira ellisii]
MRVFQRIWRFAVCFAFAFGSVSAEDSSVADDWKRHRREGFFRITQTQVNSGTIQNALLMSQAFLINQAASNSSKLSDPKIGDMKGIGFELGRNGIPGGKYYKSNLLFSYAGFKSNHIQNLQYESAAYEFVSGSPTNANYTSISANDYYYQSNRLDTMRIGYSGDILPFATGANKFLSSLGIRVGADIYGNIAKLNSNSRLTVSGINSLNANTIFEFPRVDPFSHKTIQYTEVYLNAVLGLSYSLEVADGVRIYFSAEYFQSVLDHGFYKDEEQNFITRETVYGVATDPANPTSQPDIRIPITSYAKGTFDTMMKGYRVQMGYDIQLTEIFGINLSAGISEATHTVVDSNVHSRANLSGLGRATILRIAPDPEEVAAMYLTSLSALGPYPSSRDYRTQLGIAFVFKY